jgi:lipid-binding SYLF domain-containing protein
MKTINNMFLALVGFALPLAVAAAEDTAKLNSDVQDAMTRFKKADSSIAKRFETSAGYVVFPNVGKGGFIVGGAHGNGQAYEKGKLIGTSSLTQVTVGAQVGGQEFSEIIFFEDQPALNRFKESKLEMSAQVGAVAAAEGVAGNAKYTDGVLVMTLPKSGLMAEASVGGQKLKFKPLPAAK